MGEPSPKISCLVQPCSFARSAVFIQHESSPHFFQSAAAGVTLLINYMVDPFDLLSILADMLNLPRFFCCIVAWLISWERLGSQV